MFLIRRPSQDEISEFLDQSRDLALSYDQVGIARQSPGGFNADLTSAVIGHGQQTFERAKNALAQWRHYEMGWVALFPRGASIEPGTVVAVLVRHLGFWSLNACRIALVIDEDGKVRRYGFAYGTLPEHAERGEESFTIELHGKDESVWYDIFAYSRPNHSLAKLGYPITRSLQKRFARDSMLAMLRSSASC